MDGDAPTNHIEAAIDIKLRGLSNAHKDHPCIFKVHKQLLKVNENAYTPALLAIGSYNDNGQGHMEEHKLRYLEQMLERRNEISLEEYINALRNLEVRAQNCYAERIPLETNEFVEMMLLDGCFIIELFRKYEMRNLIDEHDPIFQMSWMLPEIARDLLLFENQLPYFVLTTLFEMSDICEITPCGESSASIDQNVRRRLGDLAISFFSGSLPFQLNVNGLSSSSTTTIKHLLGQTHTTITPTLAKLVNEHLKVVDKVMKKVEFKHLLDLIYTFIKLSVLDMEVDRAIERHEVAVKLNIGDRFKQYLFGLIRSVVSLLDEKLEKMKGGYKKVNKNDGWNEDDGSIPYGKELREAGVEFEMAKKFKDKLLENKRWKSISDAIAFQEVGVEIEKAENFIRELSHPNRNKDVKKKLIENWNTIPDGRELRKVGVEFKKAKKFVATKDMMKSIYNATALKEAGIKFQKAKHRTTFACIKFSNGVLEIPPLRIEDETESFLRNLIAYERYSRPHTDISPETNIDCVTDYACFMDDLISSPKDVELLRQNEIIENWLGDDEVASSMFNKLCHHVVSDYPARSTFAQTSIDMNKHCAKRWNVWMATLRHNYFNSPWSVLSVLAAILVLGLAIFQTVFSIINN
ncbi:hypothetical protein F2P56_014965 [Juglans regia]|uniref:UPF0481 protein At3g47200-like n=2 Tax=Juglans regia TaxID=51240 RepID=A0A2I4E401_JUGRE|nr:UPF0481 protein At3g47200-like [Juglans regia]KAF5464928.1 hypothetical protein F2P56_014965 [Juglans regia]